MLAKKDRKVTLMSIPAKDVTFGENQLNPPMYTSTHKISLAGHCEERVSKRMTASEPLHRGMEHSSTHPTTGPLVPALKQPDPPWQDGIYALLFRGK